MRKFIKTEDGHHVNIDMIESFYVKKTVLHNIHAFSVEAMTDCSTYPLAHFSYGFNLEDDTEKTAELKANLWLKAFLNDLEGNA